MLNFLPPMLTGIGPRFRAPIALLKPCGGRPEEHQVVGEDPQDDFARLRGTAASAQSRAEASF
ncbi:hypothetical protein, partial [Siccirubricoccus deserti]|uniref:hypothetical protein n=1 Tax=Siccirubricoccus deserti TaxID=2013562 RepID=UPI001C97ABAF